MSEVDLYIGPPTEPDRYRLISRIGTGGEGTVWIAVRVLNDGEIVVAIKCYHTERFGSEVDLERLGGELETQAARLQKCRTIGLAAVHESFIGSGPHPAGEATGAETTACFVMDYIDGEPLDQWLDADLSLAQRLSVLDDVAGALDELHAAGQVHADVKPGNILVRNILVGDVELPRAVLVDYGVMRALTGEAPSRVVGTEGYVAPELRVGAPYSASTDLYALAMVCAGLIGAGQSSDDIVEVARAAGLPDEGINVLLAGLSPRSDERMESLDQGIAGWLSRLRGELTTTSARISLTTVVAQAQTPLDDKVVAASGSSLWSGSRRLQLALAVVAAGLVAIVFGLFVDRRGEVAGSGAARTTVVDTNPADESGVGDGSAFSGDEDDGSGVDEEDTFGTAPVSPPLSPATAEGTGDGEAGSRQPATGPTVPDPDPVPVLAVALTQPSVVCDGSTHEVGRLEGATPGGSLQYSTPGGEYPTNTGVADSAGSSRLFWTCYDTVERVVVRKATDLTTGQSRTYQLQTRVPELDVDLDVNSVVCDGQTHTIGTLSGATPGGELSYTSPGGAYPAGSGVATDKGRSTLYWTCYDTIRSTLTRTATDETTGRAFRYELGLIPPELDVDLDVTSVACDGQTRTIGTLSGATPGGQLSYTSPGGAYPAGSGVATDKGRSTLYWTCTNDTAGIVTRTATDVATGRTSTYQLTGISAG